MALLNQQHDHLDTSFQGGATIGVHQHVQRVIIKDYCLKLNKTKVKRTQHL